MRELPLVLVLLAAALAEGHWSEQSEGLSPLGVLAALRIAVPLLWRHRAPQRSSRSSSPASSPAWPR